MPMNDILLPLNSCLRIVMKKFFIINVQIVLDSRNILKHSTKQRRLTLQKPMTLTTMTFSRALYHSLPFSWKISAPQSRNILKKCKQKLLQQLNINQNMQAMPSYWTVTIHLIKMNCSRVMFTRHFRRIVWSHLKHCVCLVIKNSLRICCPSWWRWQR